MFSPITSQKSEHLWHNLKFSTSVMNIQDIDSTNVIQLKFHKKYFKTNLKKILIFIMSCKLNG